MKTLIVETIEPNKLGEIVTVSKIFCDQPDLVAIGKGVVPGRFNRVFQTEETIGANILSALANLVEKENYEIILFTATATGGALAGPLAARLAAPIVSEVTGVTSDLVVEKPIYGGKSLVKYKMEKSPVVLTVRRNYFEKDPLEGTSEAQSFPLETGPIVLISEKEEKTEGIPLEDAKIIVTGGRGIGSADKFDLLREMAAHLNAAVAASRGAVDEGWMPPQLQIGQTGKIVAPTIYFGIGVSGASQHLAGIANAKCVVAINNDEEANIFKRARFGIVEDYKKIVPLLLEAI